MSRSTTTSGTAIQSGKTTQPAATPTAPAQPSVPLEKVAMRAYQKWVQKGCTHGNDKQDWLEAEAEVKAELARTGSTAPAPTRR